MRKLRKISITLMTIAMIIVVVFSMNILTDTPIVTIVKSMEIPIPSSESESGEGNESCGTLFCIGKITKEGERVISIEFCWKADIIFPGNICMGDIYIPLFNVGSWEGYFPVVAPYSGSAAWDNAKGEHHIWEYKIILYEHETIVQVWGDGNSTIEYNLNEIAPTEYQRIGWSCDPRISNITYGSCNRPDNRSAFHG